MRCAIVASGTRYARPISVTVRPPTSRRVSATRPGTGRTGWQATKMSRSRSSSMWSSHCVRVELVGAETAPGHRPFELRSEPAVLVVEGPVSSELVDRLALPDGGQPRAGVVRCAVPRPLSQRVDQCLLRQLLGQVEVAGEVRQRRHDTRELHAEDRLDRGGRIGGSRHATDSTTERRVDCAGAAGGCVSPGRAARGPRPRRGRRETASTTRRLHRGPGTPSGPTRRPAPWPR